MRDTRKEKAPEKLVPRWDYKGAMGAKSYIGSLLGEIELY